MCTVTNQNSSSCLNNVIESHWTHGVLIASAVALVVIGVIATTGGFNASIGTTNAANLSYGLYGGAALLSLTEGILIFLRCKTDTQEQPAPLNNLPFEPMGPPNPTEIAAIKFILVDDFVKNSTCPDKQGLKTHITNILDTPQFQKNPATYMSDWSKSRKLFSQAEDSLGSHAYQFFCNLVFGPNSQPLASSTSSTTSLQTAGLQPPSELFEMLLTPDQINKCREYVCEKADKSVHRNKEGLKNFMTDIIDKPEFQKNPLKFITHLKEETEKSHKEDKITNPFSFGIYCFKYFKDFLDLQTIPNKPNSIPNHQPPKETLASTPTIGLTPQSGQFKKALTPNQIEEYKSRARDFVKKSGHRQPQALEKEIIDFIDFANLSSNPVKLMTDWVKEVEMNNAVSKDPSSFVNQRIKFFKELLNLE